MTALLAAQFSNQINPRAPAFNFNGTRDAKSRVLFSCVRQLRFGWGARWQSGSRYFSSFRPCGLMRFLCFWITNFSRE
ncbi:MAG: hypothetical protein CMJ80_04115 [Planctomycetaceae bacterium]|nr:hypothetical protein [Planctomycetaceae bacterium]